MKFRYVSLIVLIVASAVAAARPAKRPTTEESGIIGIAPATKPAVAAVPATKPASQPISATGAVKTPGQIIAEAVAKRDKKNAALNIAYIEIGRPLVEKPAEFSLFGDDSVTLQSVLARLDQARGDKTIRGVLITLGETGFNLSQASEIRDALVKLRDAGKRTFIYADGYDTADYILATGCTDVCMLGGGEIMIPGVGLQVMFAKGLMDKVGVKADYVQIGEYKGADEEYTRTEASKELKGELKKLTDSLYEQIVASIAHHRTLAPSEVEAVIDQSIITGKLAKDRGFVDHLIDVDGVRDLMADELGRDVELIHDYGMPAREKIDFSSPFGLLAALSKRPEAPSGPAVAVVYAQGVIVDGEGGGGLLSQEDQIGSEDFRRAMRIAARDESIKAIVLRIDSPGGSALASEAMWQSAKRAAKDKPLIVSIGGMAASGGYYLASAGDRIFADPTAIVGSIGVVGGKFVYKELFDKVGLNTETFSRGRNADLFSSSAPWSDTQRRMVTNWMKQTYDQFTERVMSTRKGKIKDIDLVARGRIFAARQARDLGMVDELGGLSDAIAYAAKESGLDGKFDVRQVPPTRTLADLLRGAASAEERTPAMPKMQLSETSILRALNPTAARQIGRQLQFLKLLQDRPVILASPYTITLK